MTFSNLCFVARGYPPHLHLLHTSHIIVFAHLGTSRSHPQYLHLIFIFQPQTGIQLFQQRKRRRTGVIFHVAILVFRIIPENPTVGIARAFHLNQRNTRALFSRAEGDTFALASAYTVEGDTDKAKRRPELGIDILCVSAKHMSISDGNA